MTEKEKMEKGELYDAAIPELIEQLLSTRDKIFELNHLRPSQLEKREKLIREIIGTTPEKFIIISPFFCDYGHNIHLGKNFFANYNCVMLDEAPITIGDNVFIAPNVSFYTAGHPSDVERRNEWLEYAWPITVGNNVWRQQYHRCRECRYKRYSVQRHRRRKSLSGYTRHNRERQAPVIQLGRKKSQKTS